ncbi:MAG: tyrosine-type recombinase/integrase [Malacoplasma sp.]|nr:tyrosine-type recombinase/integrase [Malacoplasma sp.]
MKINEIIELWKKEKILYVKKSTYSAYLLLLENHISPYFGELYDIQEKDVQDFALNKLTSGLSAKTVKDLIILIKMILKFAYKNKILEYKEIDIKFPTKSDTRDLVVLSIPDHKKLLKYVQENFTFKNLGIYICLSTGMRIGELCGLQWCDIDIDNGIIKVRKTVQRIYVVEQDKRHTEILIDSPKTKNSIRDIPMTNELIKLIKPLKNIVNNEFFVLTNDEKPTEPRTFRSYYQKLIKKLGLPNLKFHGLRHSFATRCIESKCDYKTVSVILGHSNISTTLNLYVHPNMEQKKKCVDQMNKLFK